MPAAHFEVNNPPSNNPSTALEASRIVKAGPCILYSITVVNTSASDLYLQLFDKTTVPADGVLVDSDIWIIPAGGLGGLEYESRGRSFHTGCVAVLSSTMSTKTIAGSVGLFFPRYETN